MHGANKSRENSISKRWMPILLLLWVTQALPVLAQDQTISQMVHTSWTGRDGAPAGIRALAQTPDGILWIASFKGLYSFDGLSFISFQPNQGSPGIPPMTMRDLFVSKSGDLWLTGYHGPAVRIHQGQVATYNLSGAEPNDALDYLQQDSTGAMWAISNDRQLVRLGTDEIWHPMPGPVQAPGHISALLIDSVGTQWVVENDILYRKPQGQDQFLPTEVSAYLPTKIREGAGHTLWIMAPVSTSKAGHRPVMEIQQVDQLGHRLTSPMDLGDPTDILPGTDGSLWIMKANDELQRLQSSEMAARNSRHKGEIADAVKLGGGVGTKEFHAFMLDANGGVWAGGLERLERFARATLVPAMPGGPAGIWYSCVDVTGDIFLSHPPEELYRIRSGHLARIKAVKDSGNLFCGQDGTLYIDASHPAFVRDGKESYLPLLPGLTGYHDTYEFTGFLPMPDGSLIGAAAGTSIAKSLWVYKNSKWSRFLPNESFSEVTTMLVDSHGIIYLGHADGSISLVNRNALTRLPTGSTQVGAINGFRETSYGVFAHGARCIGLIRQGAFQPINLTVSEYSKGVTGLVQAQNGDIWINGFDGVVRIPSAEVLAALSDPTHTVSATNFQEQDFKGPTTLFLFSDSAHVDSTGKLWFTMLNGVVSVDPKHLGPPHPPQLAIRCITADGYRPNAGGQFPPNVSTLSVQYFGVNLTDPRSVVYRYQLQGLDPGWQDVGNRTEAIYTHLRPGRYTFRVMASNGDGIWTAPVASAPFTVLPSFYQTWWFAGLCLVATALLTWLGLRARVKYVSHAISIRAEERADERIRIARELHDTLLQGVQGLLLTFHVAAEKVPADHESKKTLEKALATADRIILEGRNRVSRLRSVYLTDSELKASIERFASDLNGHREIEFVAERKGGKDLLQPHVVEEIFCIAREALANAFRHSEASRIVVELDYQRRRFMFSCRDDGRGFDLDALQARQTNGHWGLRGMSERAEKIGARFSFESARGKGTEVRVILPARRAYVHKTGFWPLSTRRGST
jgi:signal transduction histidine kinase